MALPRTADEGPLLIADISGYTSFLTDVEVAHRDDAFANGNIPQAYGLIRPCSTASWSGSCRPSRSGRSRATPSSPSRRPMTTSHAARRSLDWVMACYAEFASRRAQAGEIWTRTCDACARANTLDLKFVLHTGKYVLQEIAGSREVSGPDVVMAHRLLKIGAAGRIGHGAYLVLTSAAASSLGVPIADAIPMSETYEHSSRSIRLRSP